MKENYDNGIGRQSRAGDWWDSGIGRDTAILFAKAGAKVVVAGRRKPEGEETVELVHAAGGDGLF